MPGCPHDDEYSSKPPPGFTDDNLTLKRVQLNDLLEQVIDKYRHDPQFIEQQSKETDLLISVAQFILLSSPISSDDKRNFLNNIVKIGQDLLIDENQVNNNEQISSSINSNSQLNDDKDIPIATLSLNTIKNDTDGDFSLDDLANEFLQNESSPSSVNEKSITSIEFEEHDLTLDNLSKDYTSSSPSNESILIKSPLESILFSNRLSSQDAADDAACIWKEESSSFGQIFCGKTTESQPLVSKRISTCLFDRSLYERVTHLINLLPKQCIRNAVQQLSIRQNGQQQHRPPRTNNNNRRPPQYRPTFQQNSSQVHSLQYFPTAQNSRQYSNQQGNPGGYFADRRPQQQNRYPPPSSSAQYTGNQQQQQQQSRHGPKNNSYGNGYQSQTKKSQTNNQQASNDYYHQRGTKKPSGGGGGDGGSGGSSKYLSFSILFYCSFI
ncbi:unnamed protein product [Rotaria sordida]|uniref:Uncharacterized protein n=1 Tax=Rotaria sordida TaxID=392033 RepID=A0A819EYT3_9BILA|nr:unnamed protein product [Rotaria sordida]CAF3858657.1 unnamed protein product [Rotaria sordida]